MKTSFKNVILLVLIFASPLFSIQSFADGKDDQKKVEPFSKFVSIKVGTFVMGSSIAELKRFGINPAKTVKDQKRYEMASAKEIEQQHLVTLTNNFLIQSHETTKGEWNKVFGIYNYENPAYFSDWTKSSDNRLPMENITWWSAAWFANEVSKREGLKECYKLDVTTSCHMNGIDRKDYFDFADMLLTDEDSLRENAAEGKLVCLGELKFNTESGNGYDCEGYRLPYEAEWEYAARGWSADKWENFLNKYKDRKMGEYPTDAFYFGNDEKDLTRNAWVAENSGLKTHPVGTFMLEPQGFWSTALFGPPSLNHVQHNFEDMDIQRNYEIYDMLGNVSEWVQEDYSPYRTNLPYSTYDDYMKLWESTTFINPTGCRRSFYKVYRGGSWYSIDQLYLYRSASRDSKYWMWCESGITTNANNRIGFRLVRTIKE